jgi:hypothetical protein
MWSKLLQDWTQLGGASGTLVQSEPFWVPTDLFQDACFLVEVSYANATRLYLTFETAPSSDDVLFLPMQAGDALDLVTIVGSSAIQACIAGDTVGPPVSSFVRWKLTANAAWTGCMRITMFGI